MNEPRHTSGRWILLVLWVVALVIAFSVDRAVALQIQAHPPFHKGSLSIAIVKAPGNYWFTACVAACVWAFHAEKLRAATLLMIAGAVGGLFYSVIKWIAGRHRPVISIDPFSFHPFIGGLRGLFNEKALSFPSGHATLSFATASVLCMLLPRWRLAWLSLAGIVAAERVLENAHYVSEVVAGAGVGFFSSLIAGFILERIWPKHRESLGNVTREAIHAPNQQA